MVWNGQSGAFIASPNYAAYTAPNYAAYIAPNYAAYQAPNYAAYVAPNYAAYQAPNYAAFSGQNYAAQSGPNYAAYPGGIMMSAAPAGPVGVIAAPGTGAGAASGSGFLGGYGPIARFEYATPAALSPLPWILDFATGDGWPSFPLDLVLNPYAFNPPLEWQRDDWDPALRFWTLPFDPHLTEWLQDLNLAAPAVVAAREFAMEHKKWLAYRDQDPSYIQKIFEEFDDGSLILWRNEKNGYTEMIRQEIEQLADLMRDDRMRYLEEAAVQSRQAATYYIHLLGIDPASKPWTIELMNCASTIGNLVVMQYKSYYRRVRPSTLCPGLTPPWGPARHPAFPSGHSTVSHLIALFLLSVEGIAQRFGIFDGAVGRAPELTPDFLDSKAPKYGMDQRSPLLWLAWRIAKGRERLGVHYPSDSAAGRLLAALVWHACRRPMADDEAIKVPALHLVLERAKAEWPVKEEKGQSSATAGMVPPASTTTPRPPKRPKLGKL
jgi:hypothetical protein